MAEKKNQHFVPQFLQKFFSEDGKNIGVYVIKSGSYIPCAPIKGQASEDYFYSKNPKIEDALSKIEGIAKECIEELIERKNSKLLGLREFVILQTLRTMTQVNITQESQQKLMNLFFAQSSELGYVYKKYVDCVGEKTASFNLSFLKQMVDICEDLQLKVLVNNTNIDFLLSDNPACCYNQFFERIKYKGMASYGSKGLQIFMPITPRLGIFMYDNSTYKVGNRKAFYIDLTEKDVDNLNRIIIINANETIYFLPKTQNKEKLNEIAKVFSEKKSNIHTIEQKISNTTSIIGIQRLGIYCKAIFSFCKELDGTKKIQPNDVLTPETRIRKNVLEKIYSK